MALLVNRQVSTWEVRMATGQPVARQARLATGFLTRMKGLLGRRELPAGQAMVFPRCGALHTVGMRFAIDAIFVDRDWRVVALRADVRPWRLVGPIRGAWGAVELASGSVRKLGLKIGDQLRLAPANGHQKP